MNHDKSLRVLFFALACLPFAFPRNFAPFNSLAGELLTGLIVLLLAMLTLWRTGVLRFPLGLTLMLALFATHVVVQGNFYAVPVFVLYVAGVLLLMGVIVTQPSARSDLLQALAWGLAFGGLVNGFVGLLQVLDCAKYIPYLVFYPRDNNVAVGQLGQTNHYADYQMVALSAVVYLQAAGRLRGLVFAALAAFLVFSVLLSSSRMVVIFFALLILLFGVCWYRRRNPSLAVMIKPLAALGGFFVLFALVQHFFPLSDTGVARIGSGAAADGVNRWLYYRQAWDVFLHHPLFGVGVGNLADAIYGLYASDGFPASGDQLPLAYCHNIVLQLLSEMGLVGLVLMFVLTWFFVAGMKKMPQGPEWFFVVMGGGAIFIHAQLEYPLSYMYFLALFFCFYSVALSDCRTISISLSRAAGGFVAVLGSAVLAVTFYQYLAISFLYDPPPALYGKPVEAAEIRRVELFGFNPLLRFSADLTAVKYMTLDKTALAQKYSILDDVIKYRPNPRIIEKKIILSIFSGDRNAAVKMLEKNCRAYPKSTKSFLDNSITDSRLKEICI